MGRPLRAVGAVAGMATPSVRLTFPRHARAMDNVTEAEIATAQCVMDNAAKRASRSHGMGYCRLGQMGGLSNLRRVVEHGGRKSAPSAISWPRGQVR